MTSIDMRELVDGSSWDSGQLQSVGMNPRYGAGYLSEAKPFRSGISVVIQDFSLHGKGEVKLSREEAGPPVIAFFTSLSGIGHISYKKPRVPLGQGFSNIYLPEHTSVRFMKVKRSTPIRTLIVCMAPDIFAEVTGKSSDELIESLDRIDHHAGGKRQPTRSPEIDVAQQICGHQAFDAFLNHPNDALFLEAKAFELVALQLRQIDHLTGKAHHEQAAGHDVEKIARACEILKKEMAEPPGARELARRVGLNHNQLVQGFREMFGLGPFEYLRNIRLEKARRLIASHECNVTEAAFSVGYASLSHFSKAFRETFGINPKACA
jgi:AraC-like DNA-binding protein